MNGTQKMIVGLVAILAVAGVAVWGIATLGDSDDSPSAASSAYPPVGQVSAATAPTVAPLPAVDQPAKVDRPTGVRARVRSGNTVLLRWVASAQDVRYFQVFDNGRRVSGKVPPNQRRALLTTSYGRHCFRVVAVAVAGVRSSSASACGMVTLAEPWNPPPGSANQPPPGSYNNPPPGSDNNPPPASE